MSALYNLRKAANLAAGTTHTDPDLTQAQRIQAGEDEHKSLDARVTAFEGAIVALRSDVSDNASSFGILSGQVADLENGAVSIYQAVTSIGDFPAASTAAWGSPDSCEAIGDNHVKWIFNVKAGRSALGGSQLVISNPSGGSVSVAIVEDGEDDPIGAQAGSFAVTTTDPRFAGSHFEGYSYAQLAALDLDYTTASAYAFFPVGGELVVNSATSGHLHVRLPEAPKEMPADTRFRTTITNIGAGTLTLGDVKDGVSELNLASGDGAHVIVYSDGHVRNDDLVVAPAP
jgi:hypothetical protein